MNIIASTLLLSSLFVSAFAWNCTDHGVWNETKNACDCVTGWTGDYCETPVCSNGCGPGVCYAPNKCNCTGTGFTGENCNIGVCDPACANGGVCTAGSCNCTGTQYTGNYCQTPVCDPACQNGGTCTAPNTCSCPNGYSGATCEIVPNVPSSTTGTTGTPNSGTKTVASVICLFLVVLLL